MEDRDENLWAGLGSIEAFISTPVTSPRQSSPHSPSSSCSPWTWQHLQNGLPPPSSLHVRLDDGEPADQPSEMDLLLPCLNDEGEKSEKAVVEKQEVQRKEVGKSADAKEVKKEVVGESKDQSGAKVQSVAAREREREREPEPEAEAEAEVGQKQEQVVGVKREGAVVKREVEMERSVTKPRVIGGPPAAPKLGVTKAMIQKSPVRVQGTSRVVVRKPLSEVTQVKGNSDGAPMSLKEKREREARQFPKEILGSLDGTTSAEVRKMNATERELVLYKRKLRNRESARRSRQKRQATLAELQEEIDDLMQVTGRMVEVGIELREENVRLRDRLGAANAELKGLRGLYGEASGGNAGAAALKMKLGG